ncbi:hypothetical protein N7468_005456 [Penicillium chermesinum]|uniref:Uncharacterized protein n=1 Tax=Penicillium chermesinum TaxID=63820 RepID=A0A9W9NZV5_9EURO|nr:uncharacterized protein N7468_005456 [Penicillium chermesinum]KAJ5232500.1 hypothetical protein N7468_005456 [Penicillium chermesinum]KAJ6172156.1 hypothetical protein N7470_001223 [Penicillium chermesinum]
MPVTEIVTDAISRLKDPSASSKLHDLAEWLKDAEMKQQGNLLQCVDKDTFKKTLPLLMALGCHKITGFGYAIYRTSGNSEVSKLPNLKTLFFPLNVPAGEVEVAGEALKRGTCTQFDETVTFNAQLDYLVIYIPEEK